MVETKVRKSDMEVHFWRKTYMMDEEMREILPLLSAAVDYQRATLEDFLVPHSYWTDKQGKLYIKWIMGDRGPNRPVCRYWFNETGELVSERISENPNKQELLRGKDKDLPVVLITGDTHGDFKRIRFFCNKYQTTVNDILIILGDAGINYSSGARDRFLKEELAKLPLTLFCIRGNHEQRPEEVEGYKEITWHGGRVYAEEEYPNLIFAKDGEIYDIDGKKTMVIGGAYSVDKWYRLKMNYKWFENEQISEEEKMFVENQLEKNNWNIDVMLSHTLPYQYRPVDMFLKQVEQSMVDESMEIWLKDIESKLMYEKWYAGHFHCDRKTDKLQIMYRNVELFCNNTDLKFSME